MVVILPYKPIGKHDIVDIVEHKGPAILVLLLGFHEGERVVAPVAARVEVVGGVPAVVEAVAVALEILMSVSIVVWKRVQLLAGTRESGSEWIRYLQGRRSG